MVERWVRLGVLLSLCGVHCGGNSDGGEADVDTEADGTTSDSTEGADASSDADDGADDTTADDTTGDTGEDTETGDLCGNGVVDPGEFCDGSNNGFTCEGLSLGSGEITCDENCEYDTSGCSDPPTGGGSIPPAPTYDLELTMLEDTYVSDEEPDANFGASDDLLVDLESTQYRTFIKPASLSEIPPGTDIVQAELAILSFDGGDAAEVHEITEAWDHEVATWNDQPAYDPVSLGTLSTAQGWRTFDITAQVQAWVGGAPANGIAFIPTGDNGADFYGIDETLAERRPRIGITVGP